MARANGSKAAASGSSRSFATISTMPASSTATLTATVPKLYNVTVSKDSQTFPLPAESAPLMVLFDKGGHVLKSAEFHKEKKEWLYQLKNAVDLADRADAMVALGKMKTDEEAVAALGETLRNDKAWGVRAIAADTLGKLDGASASTLLLASLDSHAE